MDTPSSYLLRQRATASNDLDTGHPFRRQIPTFLDLVEAGRRITPIRIGIDRFGGSDPHLAPQSILQAEQNRGEEPVPWILSQYQV